METEMPMLKPRFITLGNSEENEGMLTSSYYQVE